MVGVEMRWREWREAGRWRCTEELGSLLGGREGRGAPVTVGLRWSVPRSVVGAVTGDQRTERKEGVAASPEESSTRRTRDGRSVRVLPGPRFGISSDDRVGPESNRLAGFANLRPPRREQSSSGHGPTG